MEAGHADTFAKRGQMRREDSCARLRLAGNARHDLADRRSQVDVSRSIDCLPLAHMNHSISDIFLDHAEGFRYPEA